VFYISKRYAHVTGAGTITVLIRPAVLTGGPVSAYFIVVSTPSDVSNNSSTVERRRRAASDHSLAALPGPGGALPDPVEFIPLPGVTVAQLTANDVRLAR